MSSEQVEFVICEMGAEERWRLRLAVIARVLGRVAKLREGCLPVEANDARIGL
jgi:hypothetical protein